MTHPNPNPHACISFLLPFLPLVGDDELDVDRVRVGMLVTPAPPS